MAAPWVDLEHATSAHGATLGTKLCRILGSGPIAAALAVIVRATVVRRRDVLVLSNIFFGRFWRRPLEPGRRWLVVGGR